VQGERRLKELIMKQKSKKAKQVDAAKPHATRDDAGRKNGKKATNRLEDA
jgi:hypothetical protein